MKKKSFFFACYALTIGILLYVTCALQKVIDSPGPPDVSNMKVLRDCYASALKSLRIKKTVKNASLDVVDLSYIRANEIDKCLSIKGFNVYYVIRAYLPIAYTPPVEAYSIEIYGKMQQRRAALKLGAKQIDLFEWRLGDHMDLSNRSEYQERLHGLKQVSPMALPPQDAYVRMFRCKPNEQVRWVTINPIPVYQYDNFVSGRWESSFAIWSKRPSRSVVLTKYID